MRVKNTKVYGLKNAIVKSGWAFVDDVDNWEFDEDKRIQSATNLTKTPAGSGHANFRKGIVVQMDFQVSLSAWKQFQRYHWFDFITSTSTMHKLSSMDVERMCCITTPQASKDALVEAIKTYNEALEGEDLLDVKVRELAMLSAVPTGFELMAAMTTNYEQLFTMYHQRGTHKLPDWWGFREWVETLPMAHFITQKKSPETLLKFEELANIIEVEDFNFEAREVIGELYERYAGRTHKPKKLVK